jgi:hypothetical protein
MTNMNETAMRITRVYASTEGDSHFEDVEISLRDAGEIGMLSEGIPVQSIIFRENAATYDYDWHRAPRRQYIVLLDGEIEIEVSGGERRRFKGGDVLLVEDTSGKGHRTRTVDDKPRRSIFITLPDAPDFVQDAGEESFPASDPPAWAGNR